VANSREQLDNNKYSNNTQRGKYKWVVVHMLNLSTVPENQLDYKPSQTV